MVISRVCAVLRNLGRKSHQSDETTECHCCRFHAELRSSTVRICPTAAASGSGQSATRSRRQTAGNVVFRDNTAGTIIAVVPCIAGAPVTFDVGNGILSGAINGMPTADGPRICTSVQRSRRAERATRRRQPRLVTSSSRRSWRTTQGQLTPGAASAADLEALAAFAANGVVRDVA